MKADTFYTVETERLQLRLLTPEVYQSVFAFHSAQEQKTFFGFKNDAELNAERRRYAEGLTMFNKSFAVFQLIEKAKARVIGWCGYHTWYLPHFRAEIGYALSDDAAKGKGFMKEAFPSVLKHGFEEMSLQRIEALIGPDNIPSLKLVKAFGFTEEGRLREHYFKDGRLEDSILFSLLKREYNALFKHHYDF
jgi:ribosomal-protein-alanine N-acetyltransferase